MKYWLVIFSSFLLCACSTETGKKLQEVENLLNLDSDSALIMLEVMKPEYPQMADKDKAFFGLLYFQALDKNDLELQPVEFIDFSIDHYLKRKKYNKLSYSYLYKARMYVKYYSNNYDNYHDLVLKSLEALQKAKQDYSLKGMVYAELGSLCFYQQELDLAKNYNEMAAECFRNTSEHNRLATVLISMGDYYTLKEDEQKAFNCFSEAYKISTDLRIQGYALASLGRCYYSLEYYGWALYYVLESFNYPSYKDSKAHIYNLLGDIYFDIDEYEKSIECANYALKISNNYLVKRESYRVLTNSTYNLDSQSRKVGEYMSKYQDFSDSVTKSIYSPKVIRATDAMHSRQQINKAMNFNFVLTSIIFLIVIFGGALIYYSRRRAKEKHLTAEQYKSQLQENQIQRKEELMTEIENTRTRYQEERKGMTADERTRMEKQVYNEVLYLNNEQSFTRLMNNVLNRLPDKVKQHYPQISNKEIMFCCLSSLDVPLQDIATLLDYSSSSIYKIKQRLAKKLGLHGARELDQLLESFLNHN